MGVAIHTEHWHNVYTAQYQMTQFNLAQVFTNNTKNHGSFHFKNPLNSRNHKHF